MSLKNLKTMKSEQGFTIVELLIVIIVIGILAAIIIVAYNGVTSSARDSSAHAAGVTMQKKIEAYNAAVGNYPSAATTTNDLNTQTASALTGSGLTMDTTANITAANGTTKVRVEICTAPAGATGYRVTYFNYITNTMPAVGGQQIAGGTNGTPCTTYTIGT
jgi:prepilin-type N-terminal cleavage/methylation domain-containing protein